MKADLFQHLAFGTPMRPTSISRLQFLADEGHQISRITGHSKSYISKRLPCVIL
jgi:hypothetical protein